jgi:hypothetical protein
METIPLTSDSIMLFNNVHARPVYLGVYRDPFQLISLAKLRTKKARWMIISIGREFGRVWVGVLPLFACFRVSLGEFWASFLPFGRVLGEFL